MGERSGLKAALVELIQVDPGLSARKLASKLRRTGLNPSKTDVNAVLYRHAGVFRSDDSVPPNWFLATQAVPTQASPNTLRQLSASNWKAFEQLDLTFSGVNLFFGANSSGKSTILQALLMMKQTWGHGSLVIDGEYSFGDNPGDFSNVHHGQEPEGHIALRAGWATDRTAADIHEVTIIAKSREDDAVADVYVHWIWAITYQRPGHSLVLACPWEDTSTLGQSNEDWVVVVGLEPAFHDEAEGDDVDLSGQAVMRIGSDALGFPDLANTSADLDSASVYDEISADIEQTSEILGAIVHLGPTRTLPPRTAQPLSELSLDDYRVRLLDADLRAEVNEWFEEFEIPYAVHVWESKGLVSLLLVRRDPADLSDPGIGFEEVRLQDVGYGISQLLPLVVHLLANRHKTILIEEPEAHVHPGLQSKLGDLFVLSSRDYKNTIIVETHSEPILLRLQRRVAEGVLDPEVVTVNHVKRSGESAEITAVEILDNGQLDYQWPGGFFDNRMDDLVAILSPTSGD